MIVCRLVIREFIVEIVLLQIFFQVKFYDVFDVRFCDISYLYFILRRAQKVYLRKESILTQPKRSDMYRTKK